MSNLLSISNTPLPLMIYPHVRDLYCKSDMFSHQLKAQRNWFYWRHNHAVLGGFSWCVNVWKQIIFMLAFASSSWSLYIVLRARQTVVIINLSFVFVEMAERHSPVSPWCSPSPLQRAALQSCVDRMSSCVSLTHHRNGSNHLLVAGGCVPQMDPPSSKGRVLLSNHLCI